MGSTGGGRAVRAVDSKGDLRTRLAGYLSTHHVMTVATVGAGGNTPHAATVFYAMDTHMRLIFLSKTTSLHATHIGAEAPVAVTVSEEYDDWRRIQGVQLWGRAKLLKGTARLSALAKYSARFPFVPDLLRDPGVAPRLRDVAVYRVELESAAFTDNTSGLFGRETLELA
jgi:uncharacterized protein YhbP (UPF0306 family)